MLCYCANDLTCTIYVLLRTNNNANILRNHANLYLKTRILHDTFKKYGIIFPTINANISIYLLEGYAFSFKSLTLCEKAGFYAKVCDISRYSIQNSVL